MGYRRRKRTRKAPQARNQEEKCATKWCRNRRVEQLSRYRTVSGTLAVYTVKLKYCAKCRSRKLKERHPATYALSHLRQRAKERGIPFTITLAEFQKFCAETGYLEKKGMTPQALTIDRKDWNEGYHIWNLRVLTHEENSAQGADNAPREERVAEADKWPAPVQETPPEEGDPF